MKRLREAWQLAEEVRRWRNMRDLAAAEELDAMDRLIEAGDAAVLRLAELAVEELRRCDGNR